MVFCLFFIILFWEGKFLYESIMYHLYKCIIYYLWQKIQVCMTKGKMSSMSKKLWKKNLLIEEKEWKCPWKINQCSMVESCVKFHLRFFLHRKRGVFHFWFNCSKYRSMIKDFLWKFLTVTQSIIFPTHAPSWAPEPQRLFFLWSLLVKLALIKG